MVFYDTWPSVEPTVLLYVMMGVLFVDHVWEMILAKRQQLVCLRAGTVPPELQSIIPPEIFQRARIYELHKMELYMGKHFVDMVLSLVELYFGFYPYLWDLAAKSLAKSTNREIWISLMFVFYFTIYVTLRSLPVMLYDKCILDLRYGSPAKHSCVLYVALALLSIIGAQLVLAPLTLLVVLSVKGIGYYFFLFYWLLWAVFTMFLVFTLPYICVPCMGSQVPIASNSIIYNDVKRVVDLAGFPISRVFIIHTKAMQYSNAYFYGCCCLKRIVIFDTLLYNKGKPVEELHPYEVGRGLMNLQVAAVVAHELGHWKYGHFWKATIVMKIHFLITMCLFGLFFHCPQLYEAVGFRPGLCPIVVGFIIVLRFALTPYLTLANFVLLWNLRRFEYAADRYAHFLGYSVFLRSALMKMYADHMSFPVFDTCYARWHHTHPTILQRVGYQQRLDAKYGAEQQ